MYPSARLFVACAFVVAGSAAQAAETCEAMRTRIEANIASKGVTGFSVAVVDVAAEVPGEVVGNCGNGASKIVYTRSDVPAVSVPPVAPAKAASKQSAISQGAAMPKAGKNQGILTECKDGTVSMGGDCKP